MTEKPMTERQWREQLKAGDEVAVRHSSWSVDSGIQIVEVTRTSVASIWVKFPNHAHETRYSRETGRQHGRSEYYKRIERPTDLVRLNCARAKALTELDKLRRDHFMGWTKAEIEEFLELIKKNGKR